MVVSVFCSNKSVIVILILIFQFWLCSLVFSRFAKLCQHKFFLFFIFIFGFYIDPLDDFQMNDLRRCVLCEIEDVLCG